MWDFAKNVQQYYEALTPAAELPITLAEAKAYLRVTHSAEDDLINGLISACTGLVEKYTGRTLITTTFRGSYSALTVLKTECWPILELSRSPVQSITSVEQLVDGSWTAFGATDWQLKQLSGYSRLLVDQTATSLTTYDTIEPYRYRTEFVAGYGAAADVDEELKTAIKLAINFFYTNRGDCGDCGLDDAPSLPCEAKIVANPYRIRRTF